KPDTGALKMGDFAVQASQKVQLDIDDAPFLMAFDDMSAAVGATSTLPVVEEEDDLVRQNKRKRRIIQWCAIGCLVILIAGVAVWYFMLASTPPPASPTQVEPTIIVVPSPKSLAGPMEYKIEFAPFMVEQRDEATVRFLQARFTGIAIEEAVVVEAQAKSLLLRDSIYYYLRNKTHEYLVDSVNTPVIKQDLLDIVNGCLTQGKMEDILLVNYIMK
ncbi:MAG: flagellar basal body-associated FliL family protein, partial [Bilophila sp.]